MTNKYIPCRTSVAIHQACRDAGRWKTILLLAFANLLAIFAIENPCFAQTPEEIDAKARQGMALLGKGSFDEARRSFSDAQTMAKKIEDTDRTARSYFHIGLAWHREASQAENPSDEKMKAWLARAQKYYSEALRMNPKSSGCSNNLAQVNSILGETKRAEMGFQSAIKLGGSKQVTYILNYADFLYESERWEEAARYYGLALKREPNNGRAGEGLNKYFRERKREDFGALLWSLVDQGKTRQAMESALDALLQPGWNEQQSIEQLTCVTQCLSLLKVASVEQLPAKLNDVYGHVVVGPGAKEIRQLYVGELLDPEDYPWWSSKVARVGEGTKVPRGGWPQEAFTALIVTRGDYFKKNRQTDLAMKLYGLAYQLTPYHIDPQALIKMADVWQKNGETRQLERFLNQQEGRLFDQKSGAIKNMQHKRTYELHRSLATVYSHLDKWDDPSGYRNARYQLEAALNDARLHNDTLAKGDSGKVIVDTQLVAKLSDHYQSKGDLTKAYSLSVNQADYLEKIGAANAAHDIFESRKKIERPINISASIKEKESRLELDFKTYDPPGRGFPERGGMDTLIPDVIKIEDGANKPRTRWLKTGDPKKVVLWYPDNVGFTASDVSQLLVALEKLNDHDRRMKRVELNVRSSEKPQVLRKRTDQLRSLPKWAPTNIVQAENSNGRGRLVVNRNGKNIELRFSVAGSSDFQYERLDSKPVPAVTRPVQIPERNPIKVPERNPVKKPDPIKVETPTKKPVGPPMVNPDINRKPKPAVDPKKKSDRTLPSKSDQELNKKTELNSKQNSDQELKKKTDPKSSDKTIKAPT